MENHITPNRLYRSRDEHMIAGVAGGIAQYFNIDPVLPRLGFVVLALTPGLGFFAILTYIVMAIVVQYRPTGEAEPVIEGRAIRDGRGGEIVGYALAGLGVVMLAGTIGLYSLIQWQFVWPVALIAIGALVLIRRRD
jgi:phage shock protein C